MTTRDSDRYIHIDILRAVAIIGVMVTHSLADFLGPVLTDTIWNNLHFVVVAFVAASGYVSAAQYLNHRNSFSFSWFFKRMRRLYVPYFIYVIVYAALTRFLPSVIRGKLVVLTPSFFASSFLLTGGMDIGWLTLLFIQLAVITPVIVWALGKRRRESAVLISTLLFPVITVWFPVSSIYSRILAWLPWSFIFFLGAKFAYEERKKSFNDMYVLVVAILSFSAMILLRMYLLSTGRLLTFTLHKYPPDLFYLSYGIAVSGMLIFAVKRLPEASGILRNVIIFVSKNSYGMFFVHLIVLDAVTTTLRGFSVWAVAGTSTLATIVLIWVWNEIRGRVRFSSAA